MMLIPDKKQVASLILSRKTKKDNGEVEVQNTSTDSTDMNMAHEEAAKKFLAAIEAKDSKMLIASMKQFFECLEAEEDAPEAE